MSTASNRGRTPEFIAGVQAVLDLMYDAGTLRQRIPGAIAPQSNGYSCWFVSDEGAPDEQFTTTPLTAREIAERHVRWQKVTAA